MGDFLLLGTVFLIAGVIAVPIASMLRLGSVLGYLIAGIAISPVLSLLNVDVVSVQHFAEFGVVMMLFLVGLELEPKVLWTMRARLLGLGGGQVIITAVIVGVIAYFVASDREWGVALAVGLTLALSSTAIVLQTLNENGLMKSDGGQASFSVLLFQDIAVIPMLALMPLLASPELVAQVAEAASHAGEEDHGRELSIVAGLNGWQTALVTLGAVAAVVLAGNYLTRPLFRFIARARLRELFTAGALMIVVGIALLMTLVGLSPALGTFVAGVVLANSEYRHELESDIDPFRGLLLGLFFMTVGAGIDFALLAENAAEILSWTLGLIAVKAAVLYALGSAFRIRGAQRWLFTLGLAQAGEFGFVLLAFSETEGVIPAALADKLLLVVALSMLLTPGLFILYQRVIAPMFDRSQQRREDDVIEEENGIILAGSGRVGTIITRMLKAAGHKVTVIDYSSRQLDILRTFGNHAYFGDATRPGLLESAGIRNAKVLVIAIDDREQINELVEYAIRNFPDLHVVTRAVDRHHVYELWARGCRDIIRETFDSSLRMGRSTLEALGHSRAAGDEVVEVFTEMDRGVMVEAASAYDPAIPAHENQAYIDRILEMRAGWEQQFNERIQEILARDKAEARGRVG